MAFKFVSPGALRAAKEPLEKAYAATRVTAPNALESLCRLLCEGDGWCANYRLSHRTDLAGDEAWRAAGRVEGDGAGTLHVVRTPLFGADGIATGLPPGRWTLRPPESAVPADPSEPEARILLPLALPRQAVKRWFSCDELESRGAVMLELKRRGSATQEGRHRIRLDRDFVPFEVELARPNDHWRLSLDFTRRAV